MRRHGRRLLGLALEKLRQAGIDTELIPTTGPRTAGAIARDLVEREGTGTIFVAGGDGAINEVMGGLVHSDAALGVLPAGTANVLANEMGIGSWSKALAAIPQLRPIRIPVGRVVMEDGEERYFLMMAGAGFDARMVYSVNLDLKHSLGKLAYWLAGFSQLGRSLEQLYVTVNGETHQASFCLATRVRNYGGNVRIAPSVHITDDDLEVILFQGRVTAEYLVHLISIVSGRLKSANGVKVLRANRVELRPAGDGPVHLQVDGEHAGLLPAAISVEPDALNLLVPAGYLEHSHRTSF